MATAVAARPPPMSLKSFKESLKPCSSSSSFSFASSNSRLSDRQSDPIPLRRPPKSSLSQQLQRLHENPLLPPPPPPPAPAPATQKRERFGEIREEDDGDGFCVRAERCAPAVLSSGGAPTGPFEPLVLSSPEESRLIQVLLCELMALGTGVFILFFNNWIKRLNI